MAAPTSDEILRLLLSDEEGMQALEKDDGADEYLQPLINLGYLERDALKTETIDAHLLDSALHQFIAEAQASGYTARLEPVGGAWLPDAATLTWMQDLVSIEGEIVMDAVPEVGTQTLWSRILCYRLWVFGRLDDPASASLPWSETGAAALDSFEKLLSIQTLTALHLLGDLKKLIDEVLDNPKFFEGNLRMAVYQYVGDPPSGFLGNRKAAFLEGLKEDGIKDSEFDRLEAQILQPKVGWLKEVFESRHNTFMLRLVRVYQWVNGFYYGDLGPTFAVNSFQSLLDLTRMDSRAEFKHLTLRLEGSDYWMLNILFLLRRIDRMAEEAAKEEAAKSKKIMRGGKVETGTKQPSKPNEPPSFAQLGDLLETNRPKLPSVKLRGKASAAELADKDGKFRKEMAEGITKTMRSTRKQQKIDLQKGTAIYRGSKSIRSVVKRYADKVWDWLKGIWEGAKALASNITNFIFRNLRQAYRCLADGLSLLLGNRQVVTEATIYSDFDFDFDLVTAAPPSVSPAQLADHGKVLIAKAQAMHTTLGVVGEAIRLGFDLATGNPLGWVQLGMKLMGYIKEAAGKRFAGGEALT